MKRCPFCAEEIQDAAIVCKHCGRELTPGPPVRRPAAAETKKRNVRDFWWVGGLLLATLAYTYVNKTPAPRTATKTLDLTVSWSPQIVEITNRGSSDAVGSTITAYINGSPPFTYSADTTLPPVGMQVQIPLRQFAKKDGERFNPLTHAVTVVWVGGGGYDYQSFE